MVNKGKRVGDAKKKKQVKSISFFHNPNDGIGLADPVQQFDILDHIEKEEKIREKDVFEGSTDGSKKKLNKKKDTRRDPKMTEMQERGKRRGLDKKKPPVAKQKGQAKPGKYKG